MKIQRYAFNKIVRDKMTEVVKRHDITLYGTILDDTPFILELLTRKLLSEAQEFIHATSRENQIEELADLLEIIYSAAHISGITLDEVESVRLNKAAQQGSFIKKLYITHAQTPRNSLGHHYYLANLYKHPEVKRFSKKYKLSRAL